MNWKEHKSMSTTLLYLPVEPCMDVPRRTQQSQAVGLLAKKRKTNMVIIRLDAFSAYILGHRPKSVKDCMVVVRKKLWAEDEKSYGLRTISVLGHFPHHLSL